jgi:plasmid stabilization system protein ParE
VIRLSPQALNDLRDLLNHYEALDRLAASENLLNALEKARERIESKPDAGLPAPRPYRELATLGLRWLKSGPYWIAYTSAKPPIIASIFHATADIPRRIRKP